MANYRFGVSVDNLQKMTHNTPLMTQGDVNTALYRVDYELMECARILFRYIPEHLKVYIDSIVMSMLKNSHKRFSYHKNPDVCIADYFNNRDTKNEEKFLSILESLKLFRNEYYIFFANILNIYQSNKDSIEGVFYIRSYFKLDVVDDSVFKELQLHLNLATDLMGIIEKSFYKKVISSAIAFSNGNPDFVQDNFMEGSEGLRNAIMRFSIYNGGILAGYIGQWIINRMIAFRAPEIVSGVPSDIKSTYNKLKEIQEKKGLANLSDASAYMKLSKDKARDIEMIYTKEPNIRIEIATQGIDDEKNAPEYMIAKEEEEIESLRYLFEGIGDLEKKCMCISFENFDDYPYNELSKEDIEKEIQYQNS